MSEARGYYEYLKSCGHEPVVLGIQLSIRRPGVYDYTQEDDSTDYIWLYFTG